jgi:hypothetical protein
VRQLLPALKPAGYSRLGLEISPPAARTLDTAAAGGLDGLKRYFAQVDKGPAFYTMKEEAQMLAAVRAALSRRGPPLLFGLDYEIILDRPFIAALKARAPASARAPLAALEAASLASWAAYGETKDIAGSSVSAAIRPSSRRSWRPGPIPIPPAPRFSRPCIRA